MALTKVTGEGVGTLSSSGATTATFNRTTSDGTIIDVQKSGSTVGSIGYESSGFHINGEANHSGLSFQAPNVTPRYNGSLTDDFVHLGSTSNRFKDLYLSGGVYLGGTGSANKLSDVETGTWTPIYGGNSNPTVTYAIQSGVYVKIGELVHVQGRLRTNLASGGSGTLHLAGLPFSNSNTTNAFSTFNIAFSDGWSSTTSPTSAYISPGANYAILTIGLASDFRSGIGTAVTTSNLVNGTSKNHIIFSGVYRAS